MTKGFVLRIINNVKTDKFETIVWCDHISRDSYCTCLRTRPAFWSQLHIWQVLCLHLQRLQRYRANDILPTQRNKQTLPKYLQPLMLWSALQDVSRITFRFVDSYTQTDTDTLKQYQLSLLRLVMIVINTIEKIIKVYWRRYEIRRSPKPKLHWEHKKIRFVERGYLSHCRTSMRNCFSTKIFTEIGQSAASGQKRFF